MGNLTRGFSNFRASFESKLDAHIDAVNREYLSDPSGESLSEKKPQIEYNDEIVFKKAKYMGISKTSRFFGITEDEVRRLKSQYRTRTSRS